MSIGVATTDDQRTPEHLVQSADHAMYQAKATRQRARIGQSGSTA
jgi:PleD family two-component response regulator